MSEIHVRQQVTQYTVCAVPEDDEEAHGWEITVEWRGKGLWAVRRFSECLGRGGEWDYEPRPSARTEAWLADHRFGLEEALARAEEAARRVMVNGLTAAGLLRWRAEIEAGADPAELRRRVIREGRDFA